MEAAAGAAALHIHDLVLDGYAWEPRQYEEIESNQRARDLARQLLERWIIDNRGYVPGGARIVNGKKGRLPRNVLKRDVRIDVYDSVADAYILHLAEDF